MGHTANVALGGFPQFKDLIGTTSELSKDLDQAKYNQLNPWFECERCHSRFHRPENYKGTPKLCGGCFRRGSFRQ